MKGFGNISPEGSSLWQRALNWAQIIVCGAILTFIITWITVDVVKRYFSGFPLPETLNVAELIMGWVIFIPLAYTLVIKGHPQVTLLTDKLPPRWRLGSEIFVYLVALVFFGVLTYYAWGFFWSSFSVREVIASATGAQLFLPWYAGKISLFIGMLLITAICLLYILDKVFKISGRKE
jgi:TRAP-type C4-dicarboxylate transport system permease small subunit